MVDLKKRMVAVVATTAVAVLALAGCSSDASPGSGSSNKTTLKIGAVYLDTQGFYAGVKKGVEDGAAKAGKKIDFVESNTQADPAKESQFIDTLIASKADAIILSAASATASVAALRNAHDAGVPVICYNTCVNSADAKKYVYQYTYGDPVQFGYETGQAAATYFKSKNITAPKIGVLNCEFVEVCVQRREGFEKALKESVPGYKIVANQQGTDPSKSASVAQNILTAHPDTDALYGESGGAAQGAVTAVENKGLTGKTVVFGSDMTVDLAKALQKHTILQASTDVSGISTGQAAIKAAIAAIGGKKATAVDVAVPIITYKTADDAAKWLEAHADGIP